MIDIVPIGEECAFHGVDGLEVDRITACALDDVRNRVCEFVAVAVRDEQVAYFFVERVVRKKHKDLIVLGVHHGEAVRE